MKFLELRAYLDGADKRERCSIKMMAMPNISYVEVNSLGGPMMVYTFVV